MKILSLFDGISIAQQAFKELGHEVEYYASEIDKYAIKITQKNFPDTIQLGDICKIHCKSGWLISNSKYISEEVAHKTDLIIGGSPCQDLSIAKKNREGLDGKRSGLFWEYVRILKEVKPRYFVLENVASMPKEAKQIITETLWGIEPVMINAALVSAQNRKRLFWVGKLVGNKYVKVEIPQPQDRGILLKDILEYKDFNGLYSDYNNSTTFDKARILGTGCGVTRSSTCQQVITKPVRIAKIGKGGQADRVYSIWGKSVNLNANGGGRGAKTGLYFIQGGAKRTRNGEEQTELNGQEKSNAMTSVQTDSLVAIKDFVRKLTPIECERLQSLPDNYTEGISNTQRYKCLGNGFNCEVIKHILKIIFTNH